VKSFSAIFGLAWLLFTGPAMAASMVEAKGNTAEVVLFDFEDGTPQGYYAMPQGGGGVISSLSATRTKPYRGKYSLELKLDADAANLEAKSYLRVVSGIFPIEAGATVSYHLWIPKGDVVTSVIPYVQTKQHFWYGNTLENLKRGVWATYSIQVPADAAMPLEEMGLYLNADKGGKTRVFMDEVSYVPATGTARP
jgi:hypothetical protein